MLRRSLIAACLVALATADPAGDDAGAPVPALVGGDSPDSSSGNFNVKCATNCMFVKKGLSHFEAHGKAAMLAAEDLAQTQDALSRVLTKLATDTDNDELLLQREKLEIEVADKTHALQMAAGADVPDVSMSVEKAALQAAKSQLAHLEEQLKETPDDPRLSRQRDELEEAIRAKDQAMQAAATAEQKAAEAAEEVKGLQERLTELQDASDKDPQSAAIKDELASVQADLAAKSAEQNAMTPKKECYRVCVNPNTHSQPAGRRLLATVGAKDVNNCIRLCVKVMHHLANRMAKDDATAAAEEAVAEKTEEA